MRNFLSIKIPGKVSAGSSVRASEYNALVDAVAQLKAKAESGMFRSSSTIGVRSDGAGGMVAYVKKRGVGGGGGDERFALSFNQDKQAIRVELGGVAGMEKWNSNTPENPGGGPDTEGVMIKPVEPTIKGKKLSKSDQLLKFADFNVSVGPKYGVYLIFSNGKAKLEIKKADTQPKVDVTMWELGTFVLKAGDGGFALKDEIEQVWFSDVPIPDEAVLDASDSLLASDEDSSDIAFDSSDPSMIIVDSTPSDSSDDSDDPPPGACKVKGRIELDPLFYSPALNACRTYTKNPFTGIVSQTVELRAVTAINPGEDPAYNACKCPGWKARVTIFGGSFTGSTQGFQNVDGGTFEFYMPCGLTPRKFLFNVSPAAPFQQVSWIIEMVPNEQPPSTGLDPAPPSQCCRKFVSQGTFTMPKKCKSSPRF